MQITLTGILIGIGVALLLYGGTTWIWKLHKARQFAKLSKQNLFDSSRAARLGLVEKKDAALKEMTDEIASKKAEIEAQISGLSETFQREKSYYERQENQLKIDYENRREELFKEEVQETQRRARTNAAQIEKEQQDLILKIGVLKDAYEVDKAALRENFQTYSEEINQKKAILAEEIKAFEEKQAKIIEQFKKDEEMRRQRDFYRISINSTAKADIEKLKTLASQFSKPEVLFKLIYEVYYKTALEELFKRVLKDNKDKGGIYKITNINNEMCYIGRTTSLISRWRTHAKRGCNIERISGALYDAMFEEGLENFTWEIVEVCPKEDQPTREKYWTDFYKSNIYGYNIRKG